MSDATDRLPTIRHRVADDGVVRTLTIDHPPGNVIDGEVCRLLREQLEAAAADSTARLLVVTGAGDHFSFGASVREHLPDGAPEMLRGLHAVVRDLATFPYPTLAAVRGRCLGGGLEVALACDLVFVEETAVLAAPEIRLGVFAPAATALLRSAVPRVVAAEVLLTGRDLSAREAVGWGLANRVVPRGSLDEEVRGFAAEHFAPRSAASLRMAVAALRSAGEAELAESLDEMEALYVDELLDLHDGTEGIRAFLEKRPPEWKHA